MSDPSQHDTLPSALSSLFESPHHHFLPASGDDTDILIDPHLEDVPSQSIPDNEVEAERADVDVDAVAAAATVLELAEADSKREDLRPSKRARRGEASPLDATIVSLAAENERLTRIVATLERPSAEATEDAIAEATLRELATAAVGGGVGTFGLESLQHHLEEHARHAQYMENMGDLNDNAFSPADFLHGLVTQVTALASPKPPSDPFLITCKALEAEIESTRKEISAKELAIANVRSGAQQTSVPEGKDEDVEGKLAKTNALIESGRKNAAVLRDIWSRLQDNVEYLQREVDEKKAELAELGEDGSTADGTRALLEVRGYLEGALKLWQKGQLPPAPLPQLPMLIRPETLQPPPSSLPKKRGRPARSTQKPSVVPPQLAHLVPDTDSVRARELETPIRRKGIKRGKEELEREKQREEEEGEMLRNLVGMGVWAREPGFVDGDL